MTNQTNNTVRLTPATLAFGAGEEKILRDLLQFLGQVEESLLAKRTPLEVAPIMKALRIWVAQKADTIVY
jgi:hypothetical protein